MLDSVRRLEGYGSARAHAVVVADLWLGVLGQLTSACRLAIGCSALAQLPGAPALEWQRLARSTYPLLHGGSLAVLQYTATSCALGPSIWSSHSIPLAPMVLALLHAAAVFAHGMPLEQQLEAGLLQPAKLVAWLAAVVRLLHDMRQAGQPGKAGRDEGVQHISESCGCSRRCWDPAICTSC